MEELISAFIDRELTEEGCVQVEKHLAQCPACSALLDDLLALQTRLLLSLEMKREANKCLTISKSSFPLTSMMN